MKGDAKAVALVFVAATLVACGGNAQESKPVKSEPETTSGSVAPCWSGLEPKTNTRP